MILHVDLFLSRNFRRHAARAVLCGLLSSFLFIQGCAAGSESPLTARIAASDASFTAVFPPCHAGGEAVVNERRLVHAELANLSALAVLGIVLIESQSGILLL